LGEQSCCWGKRCVCCDMEQVDCQLRPPSRRRSRKASTLKGLLPPMWLHACHCAHKGTGDDIEHLSLEAIASVFGDVTSRVRSAQPSRSELADSESPALDATVPVRVQGRHLLIGHVRDGHLPLIKVSLLLARVRQGVDAATGDALLSVSDTLGKNWLVVVQGGDLGAKQVLAAISGAGGIRPDFAACYMLLTKIEKGANAIVYSAKTRNEQSASRLLKVAVKIPVVDQEGIGDDSPLWLMELETFAVCQGHPNILKLKAAFCGDGIAHTESEENEEVSEPPRRAIVTEYCTNGDLWNWIVSSNGLSEQQAKQVTRGVLQGLDFIHQRGVVHRDVKPENVLLREDNSPVLADFGIACRLDDKEALKRECGSIGYIAPELYDGGCCTDAVDVFSTGAVLYFALSLSLPFDARTHAHVRSKTLQGIVDFARKEVFSQVTSECRQVMLRLLSPDTARPKADEALGDAWFWVQRSTSNAIMTRRASSAQEKDKKTAPKAWQWWASGKGRLPALQGAHKVADAGMFARGECRSKSSFPKKRWSEADAGCKCQPAPLVDPQMRSTLTSLRHAFEAEAKARAGSSGQR